MAIYTLDTSCALNLLKSDEQPDEDLLRLIRLGLSNHLQVRVTPTALEEVDAGLIGEQESRPNVRRRLEQFPVSSVSPERSAERDQKAAGLLALLWPNLQPGSGNYGNSLRDCQHLAAHNLCGGSVFVTRDATLRRKAHQQEQHTGIRVLNPTEALAGATGSSRQINANNQLTDIAVRGARDDDAADIKQLLAPLRDRYPDFDGWLSKSIHDSSTVVSLGIVQSALGGIAVWKPKDSRVVKLSTFFIGDEYRNEGLGQHLLFHQIRAWIVQGYEKVIVTISGGLSDLLPFFLRYGFRIEGASARRYQSGETEMVLAKHFFYERVDEHSKDHFTQRLTREVYSLPANQDVQNVDNWFLPPAAISIIEGIWFGKGAASFLELHDQLSNHKQTLGLSALEEIFYPVRFAFGGRSVYLIPIQPRWADRLMSIRRPQGKLFADPADKLLLRTDNAYYCSPRYQPTDLRGAPVLFYVSNPDMVVAGMGRILECRVAEPEDLFLDFSDLGVYGLNEIRQHSLKSGSRKGQAMALKFGWWVPFPTPIKKDNLPNFGTVYPQTITAVSYDKFEAILSAGGINW